MAGPDDAYELSPDTAKRVLAQLRDVIPLAALQGPARFLDSLMLSCYLRGLLMGEAVRERSAAS